MASEGERMARAGDYVLGLMSDSDRERAERNLEVDPAFRDAVMALAERMRLFDRSASGEDDGEDRWRQIAQRIAALPQMRRSGVAAARPVIRQPSRPPAGIGVHSSGGRRGAIVAIAIAAAFALGYLAGRL
ncbi:MAG: hypothetical protein J0J15_10390 [Mesorhizobium sp.]|nr:hypothetical protein [Mesorhizobium sp.]